MKPLNVLLVSYVFPPVGGTGVMRAASLARYFSAEGIRLDVLTTRNPAAVGVDPTLLKDLAADVTVHRTLTLDLPFGVKKAIKRFVTRGGGPPTGKPAATNEKKKQGLLKRLLDNVLLPDPQVTWFPFLRRAAVKIVRERKIDLVLITVPTFSNLLLVKTLRQRFPDLPIVVDFRDEWIATSFELVSFSFSSSERAHRFALKTEANAVKYASAVVAVTEAARALIRSRYPEEPEEKFQLVPNGYDATRMVRSEATGAPERRDARVILTHVGTIYTSTSPQSLIDAIQRLPPDLRSRLLLRFIGHIEDPSFRQALLGLGEMVELHGYLPQRQALAAMNETDYVLLLNHDPLNVGNKFYDYVGGGKPILGAVHPEGETRHLLEEMRAGWWAGIEDVEGIRDLLSDAITRGDSLKQEFRPDRDRIAQYERAVLARRYAGLLDRVADRPHVRPPLPEEVLS